MTNQKLNKVDGTEYSEIINRFVESVNELVNEYNYIEYEAAFETVDQSKIIMYYDYNLDIIQASNQDVNDLDISPFVSGKEDNPKEYMQGVAFKVLLTDVLEALNEQ